MSKLLDIVGADFQTGNGDGTLGIRCMGTGHQCDATGIGVDSKFPACQIQPIAGCFGQTDIPGFDLIDKGNRGCCTPSDGYFLRIGAGTHIFFVYRGIRVADFLHIVGTRGDAIDRNGSVGIRCMRAEMCIRDRVSDSQWFGKQMKKVLLIAQFPASHTHFRLRFRHFHHRPQRSCPHGASGRYGCR